MILRKFLAVLFMLFIVGGYNLENDTSAASDFDASIKTTDKFGHDTTSFVQGDEINIILTIKNISAENKTISFPTGKQYDFVIKDGNGNEVWRWSSGMAFIHSFTSYDIAPSDTQTIIYKWNQMISSDGAKIPVGSYTLEADNIGISIRPKQNLIIR